MARQAKTRRLVDTAAKILQASRPMTVRQLYYQLVSSHVIKNNRGQYQAVSKALAAQIKRDVADLLVDANALLAAHFFQLFTSNPARGTIAAKMAPASRWKLSHIP